MLHFTFCMSFVAALCSQIKYQFQQRAIVSFFPSALSIVKSAFPCNLKDVALPTKLFFFVSVGRNRDETH